ncbi:3-deoxy-D-manno-octulosonic acid kinase [Glaciecola sp. SC05]|uniref:3-deoxy-D-manno-octulosonic acid kinase n=1 Tax=Glaciecola sp. SC05 TaxID=1987355 RepID=UPI003527B8C5
MSIDVQTAPNQVSLLRSDLGQRLNLGLKHFDVDYLEGKKAITQTAEGRDTVYFFTHRDKTLVLRHYCRGGLYAKANKDRFLYTGIYKTRGFQELEILDYLQLHNIGAPKPVAARISRKGMFYRADIITEAVSDSQELHEMLKLHEIDDSLWMEIGRALGRLHQLNIRHDDINVKNILVRKGSEVVIIDFDKCKKQDIGNWQSANLARFYRSLIKQSGKFTPYHFVQSNWESVLAGYAEIIP